MACIVLLILSFTHGSWTAPHHQSVNIPPSSFTTDGSVSFLTTFPVRIWTSRPVPGTESVDAAVMRASGGQQRLSGVCMRPRDYSPLGSDWGKTYTEFINRCCESFCTCMRTCPGFSREGEGGRPPPCCPGNFASAARSP